MANINKINVNGTPYNLKDDISGYITSTSVYTKTETNALLSTKQNALTAGTNITISNNVISATGGAQVYYGTTEPSSSLGNDGDLYILLEE